MEEVKIIDVYSGYKKQASETSGSDLPTRETGFPSPARDHHEKPLSLDEHLVHRPAATYFVRVKGDSMQSVGIYSDDILIVDRSIKAVNGHIVIVLLNGEHLIRRLERKNGNLYFCTGSNADKDIPITNDLDYQIWGVVSYTIHKHI